MCYPNPRTCRPVSASGPHNTCICAHSTYNTPPPHTHTHTHTRRSQDAVSSLQPGQSILFLRDPSNQHDPLAVCALTLRGNVQLGWVPRTHNQAFQSLGLTFGKVVSCGQEENSKLWGASVVTLPELVPASIDPPLPAAAGGGVGARLEQLCSLKSRAAQEAIQAAQGACEVRPRFFTLHYLVVWFHIL